MKIRGAPAELIREMSRANQPRDVREFLVDGSRGTGKTLGIGFALKWFAHEYPGARMLFVRAAKNTITQAFCPDFERIVLADEPAVYRGQKADHRQEYAWPNGSILALRGLDDPGKVYSTSWDIVVVDECAQVDAKSYIEFLATLRQWTNGVNAQYLIALTNPRGPRHWLILRALAGRMTRLRSFLRDNPKWHDGKTWTPEGVAYVRALQALPGVLYQRNYLGEWSAADGMVWDSFDESKHVVPDAPKPPLTYVAAMDWGHTDPCSFGVAAVDREGRACLVREIYRRGMSIDWWTAEVLQAYRETPFVSFVVDPSRPELIEHFNTQLARSGARDLRLAKGASNRRATSPTGDIGGLDLVRQWFALGKLTFWSGRMKHYPDPELAAVSRPCSVVEEIPEYAYWRPPEVEEGTLDSRDKTDPKCADHGCFVAGTQVATATGPRAIESIEAGDSVLTPVGARRVLRSMLVRRNASLWRIELASGAELIGTPDHKVWTDRGFVRLDSLSYADRLCAWPSSRQSSGADTFGVGIPRAILETETTSVARSVQRAGSFSTISCTKPSIATITARSPQGCASTTSTGAARTTRLRISRSSRRPIMRASTRRSWNERESWLRRGIEAMRGVSGTERTPWRPDSASERTETLRARSAVPSSSRASGPRSSAGTTANRPSVAHLASMTRRASVRHAGSISAVAATFRRDAVLDRVVASCALERRADVYDLTVEGEHVYFANGILVSNCDMARYLVSELYARQVAAAPMVDPKLNPNDIEDMRSLGML